MGLTLITEPDVEPVTLEVLKAHLRITHDSEDDLLIIYLEAARQWVENFTHRKLIAQTWDITLDGFPTADAGLIRLPFGRCSAVVRIQYYDSAGALQTLTGPTSGSPAGTDYQEDLSSKDGGEIRPPLNGSWPSVESDRMSPVTVRFTVGYADEAALPASLKAAVLFRLDDYYAFRGGQDEGGGTREAKMQVDELRLVRA